MTPADTCPMTGEPHLWGDWERVVEMIDTAMSGTNKWSVLTGDRARECRVCGRWDIEWATK